MVTDIQHMLLYNVTNPGYLRYCPRYRQICVYYHIMKFEGFFLLKYNDKIGAFTAYNDCQTIIITFI